MSTYKPSEEMMDLIYERVECECGCTGTVVRVYGNGSATYCFDCLRLIESTLDGIRRVEE